MTEDPNPSDPSAGPVHILATSALLFRKERLGYFFDVLRGFAEYAVDRVDFVVPTTASAAEIAIVEQLARPLASSCLQVSFRCVEPDPAHPYRLTWAHKRLIAEKFLREPHYTHFIYVEDDLRLSALNFGYFRKYREVLRPHGLLPAFLRYEYNIARDRLFLVDHRQPTAIDGVATIDVDGLRFVTIDPPYQGCYILDRELAEEHVAAPSFDVEASKIYRIHGEYGEPERANMALCFDNVPAAAGFRNRHVAPMDIATGRPHFAALAHHLPGNFTNAVPSILDFGTLPVDDMFRRQS